ncbi:hypothetical protein DFH06DRAFT_1350731 [Mycena polygramma]|nr:hypothetical protein DFH06DRAFT_1350731 [Mycena polygramma]
MTQPWYFVRSVFTDNLRFALVCSEGSIIGSPVFKLKAARTLVAALKYLRKEVEFSPHFHRNASVSVQEEYYDRHRHCLFMDPYPCMGAAIDRKPHAYVVPYGDPPGQIRPLEPSASSHLHRIIDILQEDYALELSESGINEWPAIDVLVARTFLTAVKYLAEEKDFTPTASQTSVITRSQSKKNEETRPDKEVKSDDDQDGNGSEEDEEDDEGEEEEDSEEEDLPKKRKKRAQRDDSPAAELEVTYNISLFLPSEMAKAPKKRASYASGIMKLSDSVSSRVFDKKLLAKVGKIAKLVLLMRMTSGSTSRSRDTLRTRVALDEEDDYKVMLKVPQNARIRWFNLAVEMVHVRFGEKEEDDSDDDTGKVKKPKKKSKIPSENDILPANAEINAQNRAPAHQRTCHANDGSDYCWISGEEKEHIALGNPHISTCGPLRGCAHGSCDDETPPNHGIFATKSGGKLAPSSLLQRRAQGISPWRRSPDHQQSLLLYPTGSLDLVRPQAAVAAAPPVALQPSFIPHHAHPMLLPPNTEVGPPMTIADFCTLYELDAEILAKLTKNGYKILVFFSGSKLLTWKPWCFFLERLRSSGRRSVSGAVKVGDMISWTVLYFFGPDPDRCRNVFYFLTHTPVLARLNTDFDIIMQDK